MILHIQTVFLLSALVGTTLAIIQLLAAVRLQSAALAYWATSNMALAVACLLLAFRPQVGVPVSVIAGNGLLILGMGLLFSGIRRFDGRPARVDVAVLAAAVTAGALALSLAQGDHVGDRVAIVSLATAVLAGLCGMTLLQHQASGPLVSRVASAMLLLGLAVVHVARAMAGATGVLSPPGVINNVGELALMFASVGLSIAWSFGSLFMVLETLASVDDLTGLLNRRAALQSADQLLKAARARRQPLALLLADLDHFKSVNDRFGHEVGDTVLRRFAIILRSAVRQGDVVGRHGGEEFCIVLPGADATAAAATAERLRLLTQQQLSRVDEYNTRVTLTVGLACAAPDGSGPRGLKELISDADAALYEGKALGRNRVACAGTLATEAEPTGLPGPRLAAGPST